MSHDPETHTASLSPAAQGAAAYRRRLSGKQMEAEVFARANRAIRESAAGGPLAHARAVADNRRLWDAVQAAVLDPDATACRRSCAPRSPASPWRCCGNAPPNGPTSNSSPR